jgi:hypothetical protein
MKLEEKQEVFSRFVSSENFSESTLLVILAVKQNTNRMANLIKFYKICLDRLAKGDFPNNAPEQELLCIKQMLLVEMISKVMINLESFFVLCDCLSKRQYNRIPKKMIMYKQITIDNFIRSLEKKNVIIAKLAGFPIEKYVFNNCKLTREEAKLVHQHSLIQLIGLE